MTDNRDLPKEVETLQARVDALESKVSSLSVPTLAGVDTVKIDNALKVIEQYFGAELAALSLAAQPKTA